MSTRNLSDEEIYKLADEKWKALPEEYRTSAKSIEICEDLFFFRSVDRAASNENI